MAELGDFLVSGDSSVKIDVEMLDYGYIDKCNDAKILRGIVDTLKSGKEGVWPELCAAAEDKLLSVLPDKECRRILRLKHKTTPDQINSAKNDLENWQHEVVQTDKELRSSDPQARSKKMNFPPVRGQKFEKLDFPEPESTNHLENSKTSTQAQKTERLSGYDFNAWEKFNVDEALSAIDKEEDKKEKEAQGSRSLKKKKAEEAARSRMERHNKALEALREEMNTAHLTLVQRKRRAEREKQKGNESFRSGENEEAYTYYTRSLALDDSVAAVYSNRALVCLRTGKLETAEDDCSRALFLDPGFTKARSRRGIARLKSGKYELAIFDFEIALEQQPANKELVSLYEKAKDKYLEVEGKEYVSESERQRQEAALNLAIMNGLPIMVGSALSSDTLLHPITSTSTTELKCRGKCQIMESSSDKLTRIVIEVDSDDSDEDDNDDNDARSIGEYRGDLKDNGVPEGFTRIQIEHDETDAGENEEIAPSSTGDGYCRISITDDTDSDSSHDNDDRNVINNEDLLRASQDLKSTANEAMQNGDLERAIHLYGECIALDSSSPTAIAAYGNRSLAYLKMKQYKNVLEDTSKVLEHDPNNLKALYRRALANEATGNIEDALRDVEIILRMEPSNELAMEAKHRFRSGEKGNIVASSEQNFPLKPEPCVSNTSFNNVARSDELKNQGNEAMKHGEFHGAVDLYTRAIANDPANILFYNNRAQAYLKIKQFDKAEADASHVILNTSESPPNLKAYYRRAVARKEIGTVESLKLAIEDISLILFHEPNNKAAIAEKQKIEILRSKQSSLEEKPQGIDTKDLKVGHVHEKDKTEKTTKAIGHKVCGPTEDATTARQESGSSARMSSKTTSAKDLSIKNPIVPGDPPKTVYEFERIWRGLKNRPDLFASYLKCFKKATYKKVIKETSSPDLLSSMLIAVRDHLLPSEDIDRGISVLEGLSSIPNYKMMRFVLPNADLDCMKSCMDYISVHVNPEKAKLLREKLRI